MTRFFGKVGYSHPTRSEGVVENVITERSYAGDELRNVRYFAQGESILGKVTFQTRLSVVADAFALENYRDIVYVDWEGALWTVESVTTERPRLVLVLGGKYNGPGPTA